MRTSSDLDLLRVARSDRLAQEGFEHEQRPERDAVIARARLMIRDHLAQKPRIEISGLHQHRPEHGLLYPLPQRPAEPAGERHGKSHLWPVQDLVRQMRFERLLEQVLAFAPA